MKRDGSIISLLALLSVLVILAGCSALNPGSNNSIVISNETISGEEGGKVTLNITAPYSNNSANQAEGTAETEIKESEYPVIMINETQKISLTPKAVDPDNDEIRYIFGSPLSELGEWQTAVGDAGEYVLEINATDGVSVVSKKFRLVVRNLNRAPVMGKIQDIVVNEGEKIILNPIALDPDGDDVSIKISGWMDSPTKETSYEDAGTYYLTITASDPKGLSDMQKVKVTVLNVNRAPQLMPLSPVMVTEGEKVVLKAVATDPDKEVLTFVYERPLDDSGVWQTKEGDAGKYEISVTASDGELSDKKIVDVIVQALNKPPVLDSIESKAVNENEALTFTVDAKDPDSADLNFDVRDLPLGARFNSITRVFSWTPDYDTVATKEGSKEFAVKFIVSDGQLSDEKIVVVTVNNVNRPPEFVADIR
ncbi:MAG TPA: putative Ig domain-containing protein [Candidatus Nanoarchaeia archaeon]|nr:putative Ig domain-containing protein [Candidatus Nanoarchaeia archaeon]